MDISGKISTVYSDCIQVEMGAFWHIPMPSFDWTTTCMNINIQEPIDYIEFSWA
jgi:hypothetical protein